MVYPDHKTSVRTTEDNCGRNNRKNNIWYIGLEYVIYGLMKVSCKTHYSCLKGGPIVFTVTVSCFKINLKSHTYERFLP